MIQLIKHLFRLSKHNTFLFLILPAVTRFVASNMVVTKKMTAKVDNWLWLMWKTLWCKNHAFIKVPTYTSSPGRKQTWFLVVHSFQVFKYYWYFLIVFSSRHCLYIEGRFFIKSWNVFWRCSCGNRYNFTKSKRKNIIEN